MKKKFVLYDARARFDDEYDAAILDTADNEKECRAALECHPQDSIWFEYDWIDSELLNGKPRYDLI